jgi:hypothetical protein
VLGEGLVGAHLRFSDDFAQCGVEVGVVHEAFLPFVVPDG